MGLAIPRPAMRAREERIIQARLAFMSDRIIVLGRDKGMEVPEASNQAFKEAKALKFTRAGTLKKRQ